MPVNRALVGVVMVVLSLLSWALVKGDGPGSGEVLVALTSDNGVNSGDLPIVLLWLVGMACCGALLWRDR